MNYIKLINAFYDRLETNSLSTSAVALWHALVHINNKAAWQKEFSVAASVLCIKTGLSIRSITNARNELKQKGFISFKSRKGNLSAIYTLTDLSANNTDNVSNKDNLSATVADNLSCNTSYNVSGNASTLNKQNETKQNETEKSSGYSSDPFFSPSVAFFTNNFGNFSPFIAEQVEQWEKDLSSDLVIAAMEIALKRNAKNFGYCETILKEWRSEGIKTIEQLKAYEQVKVEKKLARRRIENGHKEYSGSHGGASEEGESITGGQIGRIGRRKA